MDFATLEPCLRRAFGLVVYEEHILQICEAFAGLPPGRADVLRRALVKQQRAVVAESAVEFRDTARLRGHDAAKSAEVWELVTGFNGYAFNKAHSTAYGVEADQAAWLKRYHPGEFMAAVLTPGKGFYHPLVYVLEGHRLGLKFLPPSVNEPGPGFTPQGTAIRVPVRRLGEFVGQEVVLCGLIIEQRTHQQVTGEPMKFLPLADRTGMVETELFANPYRSYGLATVRYPVLEVSAPVEPFENRRGFTLRVHRAGKPRTK